MSQLVQIGKFNFRFQCQPECTNCRTMAGDVCLTEDDADRIAAHLDLTAGRPSPQADSAIPTTIPKTPDQ